MIIKLAGILRIRRVGEGRATALTTIPQKGELGNHQYLPIHIHEGEVEFLLLVLKNSQMWDFFNQIFHIPSVISLSHSEEYQHPPFDACDNILVHRYRSGFHPLDDSPHVSIDFSSVG